MGTASEAVSSTRSAAGEQLPGVREKMSAAQDKVSAAPGQLRRQAAGNPLAVGLIAVGVGWLAGSLLPASPAEERAAAKVKEAAAPAVTSAAKMPRPTSRTQPSRQPSRSRPQRPTPQRPSRTMTASSAHDVQDQAQAARGTVTGSHQ